MKKTNYIAKKPQKNGLISYTNSENLIWQTLYERQIKLIDSRACEEFKRGVNKLNLRSDAIPQCVAISASLQQLTGWSVQPVAALISFAEFYSLLSKKIFPVACFIRSEQDLDYLQEPDVFHEVFGHCSMLTNQDIADFTHVVGQIGVKLAKDELAFLARLYWFTIEFGLINTAEGMKIYGGGILSSWDETIYALESSMPRRRPFDALTAIRTPYRYDEKQLTYFVLDSLSDLQQLTDVKFLRSLFKEAKKLGMLPDLHKQNN